MIFAWHRRCVAPLATTFITVAALTLSGCGKTPEAWLEEGQEAVAADQPAAAVIALKNAIQGDGSLIPARTLLGEVYLETGDYPSAEKELRRAAQSGYSTPEFEALYVEAMIRAQQPDEALARISTLPQEQQNSARMLALSGMAMLQDEAKRSKARQQLQAALAADPRAPLAYLGLGQLALLDGDNARAGRAFARVTRVAPDLHEGWTRFGAYQLSVGLNEGAVTSLEKALSLAKGDLAQLTPRLLLVQAAISSNSLDTAATHMDWLNKRIQGHPQVAYVDGLLQYRNGKLDRADERLLAALRAAPDHEPSLFLRANLKLTQNQPELAIDHLSRLLTLQPDNTRVRTLLAGAYLQLSQSNEAQATLLPLIESETSEPAVLALYARALIQSRRFADAIPVLERSQKLRPEQTAVQIMLAVAHFANGDRDAADALLAQANDSGVANADSELVAILLTMYGGEGDLAAAMQRARTLAEQGGDAVPAVVLASAFVQNGRMSDALAALETALQADPEYIPAIVNLAQLEARQGQADKARNRLQTALDAHPDDRLLLALARTSATAGASDAQVIELIQRYRSAQSEGPNEGTNEVAGNTAATSGLAGLELARLLSRSGRTAEAERELEALIRIRDDWNAPHMMLARLHEQAGRHLQTVQLLGPYLQRHPSRHDARLLLVNAQLHVGLLTAAAENINALGQNAQQLSAAAAVRLNLLDTQLALQEGRLSRAQALLDQTQNTGNTSAQHLSLQAELAIRQNDPQRAITALSAAQALEFELDRLAQLAQLLQQQGQLEAALTRLREAAPRLRDPLPLQLMEGTLMLKAQAHEQAIAHFNALRDTHPQNTTLLNNLALALAPEQPEQAVEIAKDALSIEPENWAILDSLGWLLSQQGDEEGIAYLERALALVPEQSAARAEIQYHLGAALAQVNRRGQALRYLQDALQSGPDEGWVTQAQSLIEDLRG